MGISLAFMNFGQFPIAALLEWLGKSGRTADQRRTNRRNVSFRRRKRGAISLLFLAGGAQNTTPS
jgi:hypothetical protein